MLKIYLIQNLYDLSDKGTVAEAINGRYYSQGKRALCGGAVKNAVPVGTAFFYRSFFRFLTKYSVNSNTIMQVQPAAQA